MNFYRIPLTPITGCAHFLNIAITPMARPLNWHFAGSGGKLNSSLRQALYLFRYLEIFIGYRILDFVYMCKSQSAIAISRILVQIAARNAT